MDAVLTYGDALARLSVTGRTAEITVGGQASVLDVGEKVGAHAVVNRAVAGLPEEIGWVAVGGWPAGSAEDAAAAAAPRVGLIAPGGAPDAPRVLLRRSAWDSVDGYDTRVPDPGADLRARLERAGWLVHPSGGHGRLPG